MANSRLEKVGTVFTRTTALLRAGALKAEDTPIWYNIYKAFQPKLEPRFDRLSAKVSIQSIFYEEDNIRARFHKDIKQMQSLSLNSNRETDTEVFIRTYSKLKNQGALAEKKIFDISLEMLNQQRGEKFETIKDTDSEGESLSTSFSNAMAQENVKKTNEKGKISVLHVFEE